MDRAGIITALTPYQEAIDKLAKDGKFVALSPIQAAFLEVRKEKLEEGKAL
jgi:hypothetical protein